MCIYVLCALMLYEIINMEGFSKWYTSYIPISILAVVFGLLVSYYKLSNLIYIHHNERYHEFKTSFRFFFLAEFVPLCILAVFYTISLLSESLKEEIFDTYVIFEAMYPLFQAFGMLYLKDSKDPL